MNENYTDRTIGIIGSRRRNETADFLQVFHKLEEIREQHCLDSVTIVSGGAKKGGDHFAEFIAEKGRIPIIIHRPDKANLDEHLMEVNPRAAHAQINYARNTLIANDSDILIACVADDRRGGTESTIKTFLKKIKMKETEAIEKGLLYLV